MKPTPTLLAASSLLALLSPSVAHAEDSVLNFELSTPQWAEPAQTLAIAAAPAAADLSNQPLPIPAKAANPPMRFHSPQQLPAGVYRRGVAVALNEGTSATQLLPPAPPASAVPAAPIVAAAPTVAPPAPPQEAPKHPIAEVLDFALSPSQAVALARAVVATSKVTDPLPSLFEGDSNSLVAWAVGSAEGTRTPNGALNPAYFGHTDPGNRVWNMGTFSYQHGAQTPEEADRKQLARLQNQGEVLRQRALKQGLNLTLEETLNGLDLANQSPLAAIGRVGYIERLAEAKTNGYEGSEAILVARTRAYINPKTGRWNAPGLGNTEPKIRHDQKRRADAVAKAIAAYEAQNPALQPQTWALSPAPEPPALVALDDTPAEPVDEVLHMWTSPSDSVAQAQPTQDEPVAVGADQADDSLAGLWQVTVERFTQAALPQGAATSPQVASVGTALFNWVNQDHTLDSQSDEPEATPNVTPPSDRSGPASANDQSAPTAAETAAPAATTVTEPVAEPVVEPVAIAPPTWAETREGSQSSLSPAAASVPGALPESTVYAPEPQAAEALDPALLSDAIAQPEPVTEPLPAGQAAANPLAPPVTPPSESLAPTPEAPVSDLGSQTPEADHPLGFDAVSIDDLSSALPSSKAEAEASDDPINASEPAPAIVPDTAPSAPDQ